ncbi:hypothetical protein ATCC90586_000904 [Pythium insidiosum]|nr:hypothetical protein ATCC90586_000904 [Pythium insidiosum]
MEIYLQYTGAPHARGGSDALLTQEKLFVYSSPRERTIDRCGELTVGAYVACSELLFYEDQCWLKIRRGRFSSAAQHSGYLRVEFDVDAERAEKQRRAASFGQAPRPFKHLHQLPAFPVFLCARQRVTLSRIPAFTSTSASTTATQATPSPPSSPSHHLSHQSRQLPVASVFQALECRFSDDFTQLALKVTSPFGLSGWINAVSFHDMFEVVEDPRTPLKGPVYMQNIAPRVGKWMGELPTRAIPSLQAPRQQHLKSFEITVAVERKLVKDQVWLRLEDKAQRGADRVISEEPSDGSSSPESTVDTHDEAWVVERHANTAERVMVPWGCDSVHDKLLYDRDDYAERFYRNIYGKRALPLRKEPRLDAEVVGELLPGTVLRSTRRILNDRGQLWIRVAVADTVTDNQTSDNPQEKVTYGYAIQSSAKTNVCMLQEILPPGKMSPKQFFQVVCGAGELVTVHAEPSVTSKELLAVKDRTIISAIGSVYNAEEKRMWLQVLREEIDPAMIAPKENLPGAFPSDNQAEEGNDGAAEQQFVVYIPVCRLDAERHHQTVLFALGRALHRTKNPSSVEAEHKRSGGARVVFQGRASKLFGSKLMRPSTIDLKTTDKSAETSRSVAVAAAAGEDPAQALKEEFDAWQRQASALTSWRDWIRAGVTQARASVADCVQRPFGSCLSRRPATRRMYEQLEQDDDE